MKVTKSTKNLQKHLNWIRKSFPNATIGFVPTMGALHEGHISLINLSKEMCDFTVCSIFVNPTQFGSKTDLEKYPKPVVQDLEKLLASDCDVVFLPDYEDIYPSAYVHKTFDLGKLEHIIEGQSRPGHYQGVCNVLAQFFDIIAPSKAFFGQKDFQQTAVVKKLVALQDLPIEIVVAPIKRENTGLAMSSRNERLSPEGRINASFVYQTLIQLQKDVQSMELSEAIAKAKDNISTITGAKLDYLEVVDQETLEPLEIIEPSAIALIVVEYEGVRLLDNVYLA